MEAAIIAPITALNDTLDQKYHMVLPQLLGFDTYKTFYQGLPNDKYIILDNGEAEGKKVKSRDLIKCAEMVSANEIVVPDAMGDHRATMEAVVRFSRTASKHPQYAYAGVVQAQSFQEVAKMIMWYATLEWVTVLALPRWLANHVDRDTRIATVRGLAQAIKDGFAAVHCLGASQWFREVVPLSEYPIRSIDTSLPHSMALARKDLVIDDYVARPKRFFWADMDQAQRVQARTNMHYFNAWCQGPKTKRQETRFS